MFLKMKILIGLILDTVKSYFKLFMTKFNEAKKKLGDFKSRLVYNYKLAIEHYNDPEPWTRWYWFLRSRRLFIMKAWLLLFGVIFFLFWFGLFKLFVRYESLHWFMMIVWIFTVIVSVNYFLAY